MISAGGTFKTAAKTINIFTTTQSISQGTLALEKVLAASLKLEYITCTDAAQLLTSAGELSSSVMFMSNGGLDTGNGKDNINNTNDGENSNNVEKANEINNNNSNKYGIDIEELKFSDTVKGHLNRPYQESKLLVKEIMESKSPVVDPQGTGAWYWEVEGSFNGSQGIYELVVDPNTNTVWHFVYKTR